MDIKNWEYWVNALPPMDMKNFYLKYLQDKSDQKHTYLLRGDIIETLREDVVNKMACSDDVDKVVHQTIEKFAKIAAKSPALTNFVYDTDNAAFAITDPGNKIPKKYRQRLASEFFIPWIANSVPHSIALEVVYGYGIDLIGEYRKIPESDPYFYFVYKDDLFTAIVNRGLKTVDWLREANPEKIGFLAAGMAPEFRHLGLTLQPGQTAVLVDRDETIDPEWLFKDLAFKDQITYLKSDIATGEVFADPRFHQLDALVANGFISYVWDKFPKLLAGAKQLVKPGGFVVMELYPEHWEWARNKDISGFYLPLKLFETIDDATSSLCEIAEAIGIPRRNVEVEEFYDSFGEELMATYRIKMPT